MAIYKPSFLSPSNVERDMSLNQVFSAQCNGTVITQFQIKIYRVDTSALLFDTTMLPLGTPLYDKSTLSYIIPANSITYTGSVKWTITMSNGSTALTSAETAFWSYTNPTYIITQPASFPATVTSKSQQFIATYSQTQGIDIQSFRWILYDVDNVVLQDTGEIFSADTQFTFNGFITGQTYSIESIATNIYNFSVSTGLQTFSVVYSAPGVLMTPDATEHDDTSFVDVNWSRAVSIPGHTTGTYQFVDDFLVDGNHGLHLDNGSTIYWDVDIPVDFTCTFVLQISPAWDSAVTYMTNDKVLHNDNMYISLIDNNLCNPPDISPADWAIIPGGFNGMICQLDGLTQSLQVSYDFNVFNFMISGILFDVKSLAMGVNPFLVAIRPTGIYVQYWEVYNTWGDVDSVLWVAAGLETWKQIKYQ